MSVNPSSYIHDEVSIRVLRDLRSEPFTLFSPFGTTSTKDSILDFLLTPVVSEPPVSVRPNVLDVHWVMQTSSPVFTPTRYSSTNVHRNIRYSGFSHSLFSQNLVLWRSNRQIFILTDVTSLNLIFACSYFRLWKSSNNVIKPSIHPSLLSQSCLCCLNLANPERGVHLYQRQGSWGSRDRWSDRVKYSQTGVGRKIQNKRREVLYEFRTRMTGVLSEPLNYRQWKLMWK